MWRMPPVGKFSQGHSPRVTFPKGGVAHNHDQKNWISGLYQSYSITACLTAPSNALMVLCKLLPLLVTVCYIPTYNCGYLASAGYMASH